MKYVEVDPYYENTTMQEMRNDDDVVLVYVIAPIEGYALHNVVYDTYDYEYDTDTETESQKVLVSRGYSSNSNSVGANYDFEANPSEIYAKKKDELGDGEVLY